MKATQKGMTLIGMLLTMGCVVVIGLILMQTVPVYIQHYSIAQSIKSLSSTPASLSGDTVVDEQFLRSALMKRLEVNGIYNIKERQIQIIPNGANKFKIAIQYQVTKPLAYHANLLFDFNETYEVKLGSEY
jgi:hypothetical protein